MRKWDVIPVRALKILRSVPGRSSPVAEACAVGLLVLVVLASGIGEVPILNGDEARFAQASREMFLNREWVVPTFGGQPRYDKPILIYWATAASFRVFGVTPWAARAPSVAAAALCAALLAWSARRRWGPGAGLAAGLLLAASPVFFVEGRTCTADALNLLWTLAAMLALERLVTGRPDRSVAAAFWLCTGAAVLTKGPVAPLFIGATLIGIWALDRRWTAWNSLLSAVFVTAGAVAFGPVLLVIPVGAAAISALSHTESRHRIATVRWRWGIPLFLLITLPWAIAAWRATSGEFFSVAIGRHVLERGQTALEGHSGFPGFYLVTAVILCFPWLAVALGAGVNAWRQRRNAPDRLFLLAWALGPLITLEMVQTKLVHYWLPSYPALILLAIGSLWTLSDRPLPRGPAGNPLFRPLRAPLIRIPGAVTKSLFPHQRGPATPKPGRCRRQPGASSAGAQAAKRRNHPLGRWGLRPISSLLVVNDGHRIASSSRLELGTQCPPAGGIGFCGRASRSLCALHLVGGCLLAAIPVIPAFVFDLPGLYLPALMLSGLLLGVTIFSALSLARRPLASVWIATCGVLVFLVLLVGPFLSRFSGSFLGSRATAVALDHLDQGHPVALYRPRDEEMLFSLPLETEVNQTAGELEATLSKDRNTVFCARERVFLRDLEEGGKGPYEVINRIEGLDLGRGRRATAVFFRSREDQ